MPAIDGDLATPWASGTAEYPGKLEALEAGHWWRIDELTVSR